MGAESKTANMQHKSIVPCIVNSLLYADTPVTLSAEWQMVNVTQGKRDDTQSTQLPAGSPPQNGAFSSAQLRRLRDGLQWIGIDASYFPRPPNTDPQPSPCPCLPRSAKPIPVFVSGVTARSAML
jgi:hypothetical protein